MEQGGVMCAILQKEISMSALKNYPTAALRAELERREVAEKRPEVLPEVKRWKSTHWDGVLKVCENYMDKVQEKGDTDDQEEYIVESLLEFVYGDNVFDWINAQYR